MNRIIIDRNKLDSFEDQNISILKNTITFRNSGEYTLEYVDSTDICLEVILLDSVAVTLFVCSKGNRVKVSNHYKLGKNSNLVLFVFYYNLKVIEDFIVDLNGEHSKFSLNFSSLCVGDEIYHMVIHHNHHHVSSNICNKCIGFDGASIHFQIDSNLEKGNTDCVMDQYTRIVNIGDVQASVIPNMFIEEDDVEARHGTAIGRFHENDLFYLMSRGICYDEAILLLMKGFIFSNLAVDMEKRAMIYEAIQEVSKGVKK